MSMDVPPSGTRGAKASSKPLGFIMSRVMPFVHKRTGNKMGGTPLLHLHTVGAKSGQPRTAVVMMWPDGDNAWLVVASRGGTADHPAWFYNLAAHPERVEVEVQGRRTAATPRTLEDAERDTAWERITRDQPRFADYQGKTDRKIPVVRLTTR
jgi:deazaflavin-dependent oxidoreductase (nitroreductase family)